MFKVNLKPTNDLLVEASNYSISRLRALEHYLNDKAIVRGYLFLDDILEALDETLPADMENTRYNCPKDLSATIIFEVFEGNNHVTELYIHARPQI